MTSPVFSDAQVLSFLDSGFLKLSGAFPPSVAKAARDLLWQDLPGTAEDPASWTQPVVRLGQYSQPPFQQALNAPRIVGALDQLVGAGRWLPRGNLGTFPVRFPHKNPPDDTGWHVDASFPGEDPEDYLHYRINLASKGRVLLLLMLFSDVGEHDGPTRLRAGSHRDVARILAPAGEDGFDFMDLAERLEGTSHLPVTQATGPAGTVFLCHPFLVHAGQAHHGTEPRFLAQPAILPATPLQVQREDAEYSPVELAIHQALI